VFKTEVWIPCQARVKEEVPKPVLNAKVPLKQLPRDLANSLSAKIPFLIVNAAAKFALSIKDAKIKGKDNGQNSQVLSTHLMYKFYM